MTKEQKAKWLEALRSGKYRQGEGYLHTIDRYAGYENEEVIEERFCCLGVYCEANGIKSEAVRHDGVVINRQGVFHYFFGEDDYEDGNEVDRGWVTGLPENVLNQASQDILINMNDAQYKYFSEIADWIEDNVWTEEEFELKVTT